MLNKDLEERYENFYKFVNRNNKPKTKKGRPTITHWTQCDKLIIHKQSLSPERMQVVINLNNKKFGLCSCYPHQKEEVQKYFEYIKKEFPNKNLEFVKRMMGYKFNIRGKKVNPLTNEFYDKTCVICGEQFKIFKARGKHRTKICPNCKSKYDKNEIAIFNMVRNGRITQENINEIYSLRHKKMYKELADILGIHRNYISYIIRLIDKGDLKVTVEPENNVFTEIKKQEEEDTTSWIEDFSIDRTGKICYKKVYIGLNINHLKYELENYNLNYKGKVGNLAQAEYPNANMLVIGLLCEHIQKGDYHLLIEKLETEYNENYTKHRK